MPRTAVRLVAVGGLDPSGGAGLVRDFLTAQGCGANAVVIGTAWTDQSRQGVHAFQPRPGQQVRDALSRALGEADAVKVGMVASPEIVEALVAALAGFTGPVVFDPVLGASAGGSLFAGQPTQLLPLVRRAGVTTPNLGEAALLTGLGPLDTIGGSRLAARALLTAGAPAVLVKGGHLAGAATDLLMTEAGEQLFTADRIPGPSPRGTGCSLATALAIALARGRTLPEAVAVAKDWLHGRIRDAHRAGREHL